MACQSILHAERHRTQVVLMCLVFDDGVVQVEGFEPDKGGDCEFMADRTSTVVDCYLENWNGDRLFVRLDSQHLSSAMTVSVHLGVESDSGAHLSSRAIDAAIRAFLDPPKRCHLHEDCRAIEALARACFVDRVGDR